MVAFLTFLAVFTAALIYFRTYAFYERVDSFGPLMINGQAVDLADFQGIDSTSSPLKLRGCFKIDPARLTGLPEATSPTPLTPPPWFDCFDPEALSADIGTGKAQAWLVALDEPGGFDLMLAVYPDGRGYLWRQLSRKFAEH
jgi:hypothetical protein